MEYVNTVGKERGLFDGVKTEVNEKEFYETCSYDGCYRFSDNI